jgi:(p)ppGpp synthase/HD superfamily hydrolase
MHPLVFKARVYATAGHAAIGQLRNYSKLPYIVHPEEVANLLASVGCDEITQAGAYLHDLVEDTGITYEDILDEFGFEVAELVRTNTNIAKKEDGDRKTRAAINRAHKASGSAASQNISIGDVISNVKTLVILNPKFAKVYIPEKWAAVHAFTLGHPELREMAIGMLIDAAAELGITLEELN